MDLVGALSERLALGENAARGLAGQVLGLLEDHARERVSYGVAARLHAAIPEMGEWQLSTPTLKPGTLSLETLNTPTPGRSELELLLERFHLDLTHAPAVRELTESFLASRLERSLFQQLHPLLP